MLLFHIREIRNSFYLLAEILTVVFLVCLKQPAAAQDKTVTYYADPAASPPALPIAIKHLTACIKFKPEQNLVEGTAEFKYTVNGFSCDSITFHAPDFNVSSVTIDQQKVRFHQTGPRLVIIPPTHSIQYPASSIQHPASSIQHPASSIQHPASSIQHPASSIQHPASSIQHPASSIQHPVSSIQITYTARPSAGLIYFIGWRPEEAGKRKQIWAHRPHGWLPYLDGRITVDMFVTFDKNFKVFSNGERVEVKENPDGTKTWHYAMKKDHPFFSTALVIGDYDFKQAKTSQGIPLEFWYYSDMPERVGTTYMYTERMFDFLEKDLDFHYPYPLYREAPVIDYMYGAMETTTSTVFGDYMQITPRSWWQRNYVNVNVHELAHQWFGNCVAHLVNKDVWLTESFATYYAKMFEKNLFGDDYWQNLRNDEMSLVFEAAKKNSYPVASSYSGVQRIYQKGSLVLEMLRNVMGDDEFRLAVNLYLNRFAFNYAETGDFIRCVYEASGKPYNWFFDQWILHGGEPDYLVTDSVVTDSANNMSTRFRIRQMQPVNELNGLFKMPVNFEVHYADNTFDSLVAMIENAESEVLIPNPEKKEIKFLLFDPGRKILKKVKFEQPLKRRMAQALSAQNMIDRYDALVSLRQVPPGEKMALLTTVFSQERFHLNKTEVIGQLGSDTSDQSKSILRQALHDQDALVRKAALKLLYQVPGSLRADVEPLLFDSSFLNVEYALEDLCLSFPGQRRMYLDLTQDMEGWRGKNIRMKWLEISIASGQKEYMTEVIDYCSPKYEFETRMNAFNLLNRMKYVDPITLKYAEEAGKHWNNKLSGVARDYLKTCEAKR